MKKAPVSLLDHFMKIRNYVFAMTTASFISGLCLGIELAKAGVI